MSDSNLMTGVTRLCGRVKKRLISSSYVPPTFAAEPNAASRPGFALHTTNRDAD